MKFIIKYSNDFQGVPVRPLVRVCLVLLFRRVGSGSCANLSASHYQNSYLNWFAISMDLVEECSIAGYEDEYGDPNLLPYGVQRTRTPDSLASR